MAARVLLVHPPVSIARDFIDYPYFADLGAVQLAAVLEPLVELTFVDAYALPGAGLHWRQDGRAHLGAPVDELLRIAAERAPVADVVIVAYTPFHRPPARDDVLGALLSGLAAARPGTPIVLADCYQSGQHYVEAGIEVLGSYPEVRVWLKYEAEASMPALVSALAAGERPPAIVAGAPPGSLDALPFPAWHLVDLAEYHRFLERVMAGSGRHAWAFPVGGRTLPMVTSRGCPFTCVHCSSNPGRSAGEPKTQRRYSPARLQAYLGELASRHRVTRVEALDELINVHRSHWETFLDAVTELDLRFDVPNGFRADYLTEAHLERMRGRVTTVSVSAESGVQRVVTDVVRKQLDLQDIVRVAEAAQRQRVPLMVHYIIGFPSETAAEINATLELAVDLWERFGAEPAVQFATPLPGTALGQARTLPVLSDWGPAFQTSPSQLAAAVDAETLRKFKWTFDERLRAARGPQKLIMNVTYLCNNHCTFCAVGTRTQVHGHPPSQREHLLEYRKRGVRMVDFDGGEPTLNPELIPLIRYSRALGYERINVTTNGRMCTYRQFAEQLTRSGVTSVLFSVHGPDAITHAQQVGVAEAFDQTLAGIRNCVAAAPPGVELGMNITLTKGNVETLPDVADLCWSLGLRWLNIQFLTPFGRATRMIAPDTARAATVARGVLDRWRDRMKLQIINLPFCFLPGYEAFMVGDLQKLSRHMIFVNNEDVNLADYLAERRTRKPECAGCPHAIFCGGFYELDSVPEPPWLIRPEELIRSRTPSAS